ncbi:MAG: TolC family protein [Fimbriimonadaceae bacterium]|nr:TolC family protein [Fimbriimonadaceae bacterium]
MKRLGVAALLALAVVAPVWAQTEGDATLTLEDALILARQRNGDVRSAFLSVQAAEANLRASRSAFLPTVTASLRREDGRLEQYTGNRFGRDINQTSTSVSLNYLILDNGDRKTSYEISSLNADITYLNSRQTFRTVLFNVHSRFYDALRAQELLRVREAQLARSEELLKATEARVNAGDTPPKDILQARADFLNAKASELQARNSVNTSEANLKAILGWTDPELPELVSNQEPTPAPNDAVLDDLMVQAKANRPDIVAARRQVDSRRLNLRQARLDTSVNYTLNAQFTRSFNDDVTDRPALIFQASYPLYDGEQVRSRLSAAEYQVEAQQFSLAQAERDLEAEVESTFKTYTQNVLLLEASDLALEAARLNYNAAAESQRLGASDLIEVLTAQVTLVTAETNRVQSLYDLLISEVRLNLVVGDPVPGEIVQE